MSEASQAIEAALHDAFQPTVLEVINESHLHAGHRFGGVDSHFALKLVSEQFEKKSLVQRHRLVYDCLDFAFKKGLHALKIKAYTPAEWKQL